MLVIVNPYATTVSDRLKNLVVYALRGRYEVDAVDTEARDHATELCREAAREGYDVVVAFGGDGTVNEAANGLAGSDTPLSCLPGGRANVYCRMLGIPADVVDATEHLLRIADDWRPRGVDLGQVNGRKFVFSAGVGLDASVVERVDAHPRLKARFGEWYYTWTGDRHVQAPLPACTRRGWRRCIGDERVAGVTAIVQNADPVHVLRQTARSRWREGATLVQRRPGGRRARARPARSTSRRSSGARCQARDGHRPPPRPSVQRRRRELACGSLDDRAAAAAGRRRLHRRRRTRRVRVTPRGIMVVS